MKKAIFALAAFALPSLALAADACSNLKAGGVKGISECIIVWFDYAAYVLMAASVAYVVWGAFQMMRESTREEGKGIVTFGIIGLFVMVSIWGLVAILSNTFKGFANEGPITPPPLEFPSVGGTKTN